MDKRLTLDSKIKLNMSSWDFYGLVFFLALILILIPTWPKLPYFMDCYYHLSVMRGFADAGGWTKDAFWEFAPVGRPHLYPPLFHFFELAVYRMGMAPVAIGRFFDFFIYPLFLFSFWWPLRSLFDKRLAFFTLLLLASSTTLYLGVINNIPFSLAMIFSFLAYFLLKRGRVFSASAAMTAAFYAHTLMSLLGAAAFLGACLFLPRRERTRGFFALGAALLAAIPLFVHQIARFRYINFAPTMEFYYANINIALCIFALMGFILFLRKNDPEKYFMILLIAMSILLMTNRDRFLSGVGLVPLAFFGAIAMDWLWCRARVQMGQVGRGLFWGISIAIFFLVTPVLHLSPLEARPLITCDSSLATMTGLKVSRDIKSQTLYYPKLVTEAVRLLEANSSPDDIVFSNSAYGGGMIAVLAHRVTSFAMLHEVKPYGALDPLAVARQVIWFKNPDGSFPEWLKWAVNSYHLREIGQTGLIYLYENPIPTSQRRVTRATVPEWACFVFIGLLAAIFLIELFLSKKIKKS